MERVHAVAAQADGDEAAGVGDPRLASGPMLALAVVTGPVGVLVGRRRDGVPPWVFPGGKVEVGESAAQAAVRECLETGLEVWVADC
jgi:8-oxo-dGTP pyrophosphatase MutT (NUDIX family)